VAVVGGNHEGAEAEASELPHSARDVADRGIHHMPRDRSTDGLAKQVDLGGTHDQKPCAPESTRESLGGILQKLPERDIGRVGAWP